MKFIKPLLAVFAFTFCSLIYSQVSIRDTTIQWQHFNYSMDEYYSLSDWSTSEIITTQFSGIVMENELVKLCLIPEFGGRVISFVYKPTGKEQLYQNPIGVPYAIGSNIFYHNWLMVYGGIFPTFPEPEHGKYWNVPWDYSIEENTSGRASIKMTKTDTLANPQRGGQYNNGVTGITCNFIVNLQAGDPFFTVDVDLINNSTPSQYEYWTCITFSPGSEIGDTSSPSQSEMIVPIDQYQIRWNEGNWMQNLDVSASSGDNSIKKYDKLAHLSNWQNMGIAYAYPTLVENYYGVINHTNEQGLFRISSDQSTTPGMKFWTWGDAQGQAADPMNFYENARPYIELWSGTSQEFFEDASLAANETVSWTETYFPTVGVPCINYIDKEIAFCTQLVENELVATTFLPISSQAYTLTVEAMDNSNVVWSENVNLDADPLTAGISTWNLSSLDLPETTLEINVSLYIGGSQLHSEAISYDNTPVLALEKTTPPEISIPSRGTLRLTFKNRGEKEIRLFDLQGRSLGHVRSIEREVEINYPSSNVYLIHVLSEGTKWSKKIAIRSY